MSSSASGFSTEDMSPGSCPSTVARTARRTIFADRVFGKEGTNTTRSGANALPELLGDERAHVLLQRGHAGREHAEHPCDLALDLVRHADRRRLGDRGMRDRGRLELGRPDALAGDVQRVVGAPVQEPVAVLVDRGPVAVRPHAGEAAPVRLQVALGVAPEPARHPRERLPADELADLAGADQRPALGVDDVHRHSRRRPADGAVLDRLRRTRPEEDRADLRPAGDVDDRAAPASHPLEEPAVRVGVPRLARRDDRPQRREVGLRISVGDQRADQRRGAPEHRHALLLDQPPEPVGRPVGRAFGEDDRRAERTAADHSPGAHDPAHVGREVDDVTGMDVREVGGLPRDRDEQPAVDVEDALRLARRPRGVGEQVRMLRVDRERGQRAGAGGHLLVPRGDEHVLERRRLLPCLLEDLEHRHLASAAQRCARRDRDFGLGVDEPLGDGRRREPGEDRHLDRADVRAGVRGDRRLRRHRQIDRDPVAGLDAELDQALRQPRDRFRELGVGQRPAGSVLAAEDRGREVAPPPVHAVPGDVQLPAQEPGRPLGAAREVDDLLPGLEELEPEVLDGRRPEPLRLVDRARDELPVAREPVPPHQPDDVRVLERLLVRAPDHLCHGRNPTAVSLH